MQRIPRTGTPFVVLVSVAMVLIGCQAGSQVPGPSPSPTSHPSSAPTPTPAVPANVPSQPSAPQPSAPRPSAPQPSAPQPTSTTAGGSWVAYASGLANDFTKGEIASLEQPFELEGDGLPVSSGLVAYFRPTGPTSGEYTYNNHIIEGPCDDSSYGTYAITFYTANEGDIVMTGPTTRTCGVVTVFDQITEIRIAIRRQ